MKVQTTLETVVVEAVRLAIFEIAPQEERRAEEVANKAWQALDRCLNRVALDDYIKRRKVFSKDSFRGPLYCRGEDIVWIFPLPAQFREAMRDATDLLPNALRFFEQLVRMAWRHLEDAIKDERVILDHANRCGLKVSSPKRANGWG